MVSIACLNTTSCTVSVVRLAAYSRSEKKRDTVERRMRPHHRSMYGHDQLITPGDVPRHTHSLTYPLTFHYHYPSSGTDAGAYYATINNTGRRRRRTRRCALAATAEPSIGQFSLALTDETDDKRYAVLQFDYQFRTFTITF